MSPARRDFSANRRTFLSRSAGGLGAMALAQLLSGDNWAKAKSITDRGPLAPKLPHHRPRAKSVICLFQHGGPSQMALFDPKPLLTERQGTEYPGTLVQHFNNKIGKVLAAPFKFQKHGRSGMELSELIPHTARIADDLTLVRSMVTDQFDHGVAIRTLETGKAFAGRPTLGSWLTYGLGTERQNLPAYVVLTSPGGLPINGPENWTAGFLPAVYQGTVFRPSSSPILNLSQPETVSEAARRNQLLLLEQLNQDHLNRYPENSELAARVTNYELAAQMQTSVPDLVDLSNETTETHRLYGLDQEVTRDYGRRCLLARRLVESGVRFVLILLNGQPWDTHGQEEKTLRGLCPKVDQPSAALVTDLKQRGLLEDTIVLWGGEFGRQPVSQGTDGGRDHNPHGFSLWLAGGGFKSGHVHGATDEFGYQAIESQVSPSDLHATLLHLLGLDHHKLSYMHDGLEETLTDARVTKARVVNEIMA
jgi:uncharacterized protein (DUF1501 family)